MRRLVKAAAAAAGLALAATGCGVQSTGVNVAQAEPFSLSGASTSQAPSQSAAQYQMVLFFMPLTPGLPRQTVRFVTKPVRGVTDLLQQLKSSSDETLQTFVPPDLQLVPSPSTAHQYIVQTEGKLLPAALEQLACTFSYYWRQHPDRGAEPSISLILPSGATTTWNDCTYLLGPASEPRASAIVPSEG